MSSKNTRARSGRRDADLAIAVETLAAVQRLRPLLKKVAKLSLNAGLALDDVVYVLKLSLIEAARPVSCLKNGRLSHSNLAATTGLTRPEVAAITRLLGNGEASVVGNLRSKGRPIRVVRAWHALIRRPSGREPWTLPFEGHRSFCEVVRRSAGDVPPRAMLHELTRLRWVHFDAIKGTVTLLLKQDGQCNTTGTPRQADQR